MIAFKHSTGHKNLNTFHFANAYILFDIMVFRRVPCKVAQNNDLLLNAEKHFEILLHSKFSYIILWNV